MVENTLELGWLETDLCHAVCPPSRGTREGLSKSMAIEYKALMRTAKAGQGRGEPATLALKAKAEIERF